MRNSIAATWKKMHWAGLILAAISASGVCAAAETPATLEGVTVVDAAGAKALMDGGAKMIDTRVVYEYANTRIKGAISIPYGERSARSIEFDARQDSFDLSKLPADKGVGVITYCNGPKCWKSYKAAKTMAEAGYRKVYWFRGGFPEWKAQGYPVEKPERERRPAG